MRKKYLPLLVAGGCLFASTAARAQFADSVVAYSPGTGASASFTNPNTALGEPSRINPFGESVDPFNPPYGTNQVVSLGAGGLLTVQFGTPIVNDPSHPFGLDFVIFGNSGFAITNGDFSGGGITDGSLFSNNTGTTRVSVSLDNITYYALNPAVAPTVDGLFPTDSNGNFLQPANPALTNADFSGQDLAGIRTLYAGSAGGTGFDLAWAQDGGGNSVTLPGINFVRVEVLSGKSEIDGIAAVPEPASWVIALAGALLIWGARAACVRLPAARRATGSSHPTNPPLALSFSVGRPLMETREPALLPES
jgi:hypothetical protein